MHFSRRVSPLSSLFLHPTNRYRTRGDREIDLNNILLGNSGIRRHARYAEKGIRVAPSSSFSLPPSSPPAPSTSWSSLYQWMLVWRRRHASLSFQRAVTPTRLTSTKPTYTLRRQSLVTSLETVHPRAPPFQHPLSAILRVSCPLLHSHTRADTHTCAFAWTLMDPCVCVCVCQM